MAHNNDLVIGSQVPKLIRLVFTSVENVIQEAQRANNEIANNVQKISKRDKDIATKNKVIATKDRDIAERKEQAQKEIIELKKIIDKLRTDNQKLRKDLSQFQRSILLIGRTGSGKSSLANTLLNKNDNFEEVFKEKSGSTSGTKEVQVEEFRAENNIKYRIIDIIGFNDTKLPFEEVINKVKESICEGDYNLNQVLFLFNGKLEKDDLNAFNNSKRILVNNVFDENIIKYITIVRTGFPGFEDEEECKNDLDEMINENEENAEIFKSCNNKLVHVDNPSLNGRYYSEIVLADNKKRRIESRKKLLDHLFYKCQESYQG